MATNETTMSDLEITKKERSVTRRLFTRSAKDIENDLEADEMTPELIVHYKKLQELSNRLNKLDEMIKSRLLEELDEDELEKELENQYEYKAKWLRIDASYEKLRDKTKCTQSTKREEERRAFKLPKLEMQTFDGQLKNWLPFWNQFEKINDDAILDETEKYQYLVQSMKDEAKKLVEAFPASSYKNCIQELKSRYARDDLLIQTYIREILELVLTNKHEKMKITSLYDKLNAQLRALEYLHVTQDKYAAFLLPLVESALPQEILRIWERTRNNTENVAEELSNLLKFLKKEVESEQRLEITKKSFNECQEEKPVTAECLVSNIKLKKKEQKPICIWCEKENHASIECYKINKMSVEERKNILKEKKACMICLKKGHYTKTCRAAVKCLICGRRHSTVLCDEKEVKEVKTDSSSLSASSGQTLLQTLIVQIEHEEQTLKVRALLDSGSQRTYIKEDIVKKLNIPATGKEKLTHVLFGGVETTTKDFSVYDLNVSSLDNTFKIDMSAIGQNNICGNIPKVNANDNDLNKLLNSNNITLTDRDINIKEIGLLIGADCLGFLLTGGVIQLRNGMAAVKTKLGWTLQGKQVNTNTNTNLTTVLHCNCDDMLTDYWSLESLGIRDPTDVKSKEEIAAETMLAFKENITTNEDDRYEVNLPFKTGYTDLLTNFDTAKRRLESMTRKLIHTDKYNEYDSVFKTWLDLGIIEPADTDSNSGHYLPHRPVIKEQSLTSNIRPVFDASAKDRNGLSLNSCLEKGKNMIDLIPDLINNFRKGNIGITADIEKAFLQISLDKDDRNYLKFLWYKDNTLQNLITYKHCRVVFGLTSSPFLLSATLHHHLNTMTDSPLHDTAKLLDNSLYVDNCLVSVNTKEEAGKFITEAREIMNMAKFNLRMWVTSQGVNETGKEVISVLGLNWDPVKDELYCNCSNLPPIQNLQNITKRVLLSITQRVFDPIGFTAPVMLTPKLILQEAWRLQLGWDDKLPNNLLVKLTDWYKHVTYLQECRIPRRLSADTLKEAKVSLHLFTDASKDGCGACILLRAEKGENITVQMVAAKSRVTPPKKVTIPRLELTAALIGSRLLANLRNNLKLENCKEYCWTDSGVTLCWIKRELELKTFIGNRVREIRSNTNISDWYHISGEHNWADLASRGCEARTLLNTRWWEGPPWLLAPPHRWPRSELQVDEHQVNLETKKTVINTVTDTDSLLDKLQIYFSKYIKIIRMTAWILRFLHNIKHANNKKKGEITYSECEKAEKVIIRLIQENNKEFIEKKTGNLTKFIDSEGIVRIKTKLLLAEFPESVKTPYLLPPIDPIVKLMVRTRHMQLQHAGSSQLISDIRTKYWIVGIRRLVRSVISSCIVCRRHRAKATLAPTAPLPLERVTCAAPFQTTGVDLAGPLLLRDGEKCWIVLYTCAVYRAVHLELTRSLSTEAFIMTLRRFTARRGRVSMMMSDQGTNFHGTRTLLNALDWNEVERQSTIKRITWKMNAPSAAWWGGYWERLIRIMKDLLKRILGKASVSYDELHTIICDCEATMNGRPLTYLNNDEGEYLEPLTPYHFIQPLSNSDVTDLDEIDSQSLNTRLRYLQSLREQFRLRFKAEYLTFLVQKGNEKKDNISIGDVVLIETEEKRIKWPLGIVEEIYTGKDGIGRTIKLKTSTGTRVRRIYKLEISGKDLSLLPQSSTSHSDDLMKNEESKDSQGKDLIGKDNPQPFSSRSGRRVKFPSKFDLYEL